MSRSGLWLQGLFVWWGLLGCFAVYRASQSGGGGGECESCPHVVVDLSQGLMPF